MLKQVKAGGDFAKLAQEHSQDGSAAQGGDLNYFPRGQMVPEFDKVAFSLKPGQVSDVVQTQFGYHIIKVTDHKAARTVSVRGSEAAQIKQFLDAAEAAAARGRVHRRTEEEVQDRGPDLNEDVLPAAAAALSRGEPAALVTIVRANGSTPQRTGAKMLVFADGRTVGTIGGGCYESDAIGRARDVIASGKPVLATYDLNDDFVQESGLICGGQMEVYIDPVTPAPRLYVVGGGHVGWQLARVASDAGFRIHVIDDREKFANLERFPMADAVVVEDIGDVAAPRRTALVGLRRGRHPRTHP